MSEIYDKPDKSHRDLPAPAEEEFRKINDALPVLISFVDSNEVYRYCNAQYEHWFGLNPGEIIGKSLREVIGEEAYRRLKPRIDAVLAGERVTLETHLDYAHGPARFVHVDYIPQRDGAGTVVGYQAMIQDISERKQSEARMQQAVARLKAVVDAAVDGIITIDASGIIESFNGAASRIFGYTPDEVIGRNVSMLMPDPDRSAHDQYIRNYLDSGVAKIIGIGREVVGLRKDGSVFPMELAVSEAKVGDRTIFAGIVRDITERHRAEERLRRSEERLRLTLSAGKMGTWSLDLDSRRVEFDSKQYELCGIDPNIEITGEVFQSAVHEDDRERMRGFTETFLATGDPEFETEYRVVWPGGEVRWIVSRGALVRDHSGRPLRMIGVNYDNTERKRAELEVAQARAWFEQIAQTTPDILIVYDIDQARNIYVNREVTTHLGFSVEEMQQATAAELAGLVHPDDRQAVAEWQRGIDTAQDGDIVESTYRVRHKEGHYRWLHSRRVAFSRDAQGRVQRSLSISRDITEAKEARDELASLRDELANELAAMTRLHEFTQRLLGQTELKGALEVVLDAAISLHGAAKGNIQLYDERDRTLRIAAQCGFDEEFLNYFDEVKAEKDSACGLALGSNARVIIEDAETDERFAAHREIARKSGFRAVISTPLFGRSGNLLGMLSTHFATPHRPDEAELRLTDLYARQAADVIELMQGAEAIRNLNEDLENRVAARTALARRQAEQLRSMARRLSSAEQHERYRIADLIHGHLQQILTAVLMRLQSLPRHLSDEKGKAIAEEIHDMIREAIGETRAISNQLSPPMLQHSDLGKALDWLAGWMKDKYQLNVRTNIQDGIEPESNEVKVSVFEAARELLFNVVKHAKVDEAEVKLEALDGGHAVICISDSGGGCDRERWEKPSDSAGGFGLWGISERLQILGCDVRYESEPGAGFRAEIQLPLTEEAARLGRVKSEKTGDAPLDSQLALRLLVVDDHALVRAGLIKLLEEQPGIDVVGECAGGDEALKLAGALKPDLILVDVMLSGMDVAESTRAILQASPDARVIGLAFVEEDARVTAMLDAGAVACLGRREPIEEFVRTLRRFAAEPSLRA